MAAFRNKTTTAAGSTLVSSSPLREHQPYVEKLHRISVLGETRAKLISRIRDIELTLVAHVPADDYAERHIAAAESFAQSGVAQVPAHGIESLRDEHAALRTQLEFVDRELQKQHEAANQIAGAMAAQTFEANRSVHEAILTRYVATLRELDSIVVEEESFLAELHSLGYDVSPQDRALWHTIGTLADPFSAITMRLREMRAFDRS